MSNVKYFILFLCIFYLFNKNDIVNASNFKDSIYYAIEAKYQYGIGVPHHPDMFYIVNDYIQSGEINFIRRRYRTNDWESNTRRLETGLGIWFSSLGRDDIYGHAISVYPFINLHLFKLGQLSAKSHVALGFGYATKPFDRKTNPYNNIFGSHYNAYIGLGLMLYYPVTNKIMLTGGLSVNHLSNGATKKPNNGINTASLTIGARYNLTDATQFADKKTNIQNIKKHEFLPTFSAGRNNPVMYYNKKFWSGSLTLTHLWYVKNTLALGLGLDFIDHGGAPFTYKHYSQTEEFFSYSFKDYFYFGTFATLEYHLGPTSLYMAPGYYIYYKTKPRQPVYARLGVRQKIYKNIYAHFGIKSSFFVAEFIEFGLGYRFKY
jgi:hypothetical protein